MRAPGAKLARSCCAQRGNAMRAAREIITVVFFTRFPSLSTVLSVYAISQLLSDNQDAEGAIGNRVLWLLRWISGGSGNDSCSRQEDLVRPPVEGHCLGALLSLDRGVCDILVR